WRALPANERRVARALAVVPTPLHSKATAAAGGIKRSSISMAPEGLRANADPIRVAGTPRPPDPRSASSLQRPAPPPLAGSAPAPLHSKETAAAVGIKRSSISMALEALLDNADAIRVGGKPRLTDPLFEYWLQQQGLTPVSGSESDPDAS